MSKAYQFAIGDFQCTVLLEAAAKVSSESNAQRYLNVSAADVEAEMDGATQSENSCNILLIDDGQSKILADVGFGAWGPPHSGQLRASLDAIELAPSDVDIVYLTHFHGDHIAGMFDADGEVVFPNARYLTTQAEWDEWTAFWANSDIEEFHVRLDRLQAIRDRFSFVEDGDVVVPGLTVVDLAGHTLGQSGLLIESQGDRLLHVVDILHQPFQFARTEWQFMFDSDGDMAVNTRRRALQRCADEGLLTLFYHLKFPGLGTVKRTGDAFSWHPIN